MWLLIVTGAIVILGTVVMILEKKQKPSTISNATKDYLYRKQMNKCVTKRSEIR